MSYVHFIRSFGEVNESKIGQIYFCEQVEKYNNFHFLSNYKDLLLQCIFKSIMWVHFPLHLCYQFQSNL